jgi:hypothetical protein
MAHSCPACGESISIWRSPQEFACPRCNAPLRVRNAGAIVLAVVIMPIIAEIIVRSSFSGSAGWGFALALILCLTIGAQMYYSLSKIEKA